MTHLSKFLSSLSFYWDQIWIPLNICDNFYKLYLSIKGCFLPSQQFLSNLIFCWHQIWNPLNICDNFYYNCLSICGHFVPSQQNWDQKLSWSIRAHILLAYILRLSMKYLSQVIEMQIFFSERDKNEEISNIQKIW